MAGETMPEQNGGMREAALGYARQGIPIFPVHHIGADGVCSCGGPAVNPRCKPGKHPIPPGGHGSATTDREVVEAWWTKTPRANIGMPTGRKSGVVVLDGDGERGVRALEEAGYPDDAPRVKTGSGGLHVYAKYPDDAVIRNSAGKLGPGLDVRGEGGYVLLPPSRNAGGLYEWIVERNGTLPGPPPWFMDLLGNAGTDEGTGRFDTATALAGVPEGERDETLFRLACKLRNADVPKEVAEKLVLEAAANCEPPFPENEARQKVSNAYGRYEPGSATKASDEADRAEQAEALVEKVEETGDPDFVWDNLDTLAKANAAIYQKAKRRLKDRLGKDLNLNDLEKAVNAARKEAKDSKPTDDELRDRWAEQYPGELVFGLGDWMHYGRKNPGVWSPAGAYEVESKIEDVCVAAKPEGIRPTAALVASVEKLARNKRTVSDDRWDADPDILVCRNGALHIPSRELRPHDPAHYATSSVPYDYDAKAVARMWERFLREIILPVVGWEGVAFLQEFAGYALTTDVSHEIALWLCGPPGGGRSTFIFAMEAMLGERTGTLGLQEISTSQFALADVPGKTLLTATEQPAGYMKASYVLNKLISGDRIKVEEKYKSAYDVYPKAKLLWAMNDLPKVASSYDGLFRRVKVIRLPEIEKKDPRVKETIATEGAGILNWSLEGLARLKKRGRFEVPETVESATQEWKKSNDVAAMFVTDQCERGEDYKTQSTHLYTGYSGWCRMHGFTPKNIKNVAEDWERLGFRQVTIKGRSYWRGLRVKPVVFWDDVSTDVSAQGKAG